MADFTKQIVFTGEEDTSSSSGSRREGTMRGRPDQFVLDMESISLLSHTTTSSSSNNNNTEMGELGSTDLQVPKNLSRKGSPSVKGTGNNNNIIIINNNNNNLHASRGSGIQPPIHHHNPGQNWKPLITVDSPANDASAGTPEATTLRRKRAPPSPWLDPRRILLIFATISSVGTLVLLYFTLSLQPTDGGDHNPQ